MNCDQMRLVHLMRKDLTVEGIRETDPILQGRTYYDGISLCLWEECGAIFEACGGLPLCGKDVKVVQVGGPSVEDAERAVCLVNGVHRPSLRELDAEGAAWVWQVLQKRSELAGLALRVEEVQL